METVGKSIGIKKQMDGNLAREAVSKLIDPKGVNQINWHVPSYDAPVLIDPQPLLAKYGVHKRHQHISFTLIRNYGNVNQCDKQSFEETYKYAKSIKNAVDTGRGLILQGKVGTGKTTLAIATLRMAVQRGIRCLFVNNISLNDKLLNLLNSDRKELANYDKLLRTVPLLVIDDFGAESDRNNHSWIVEKMESIIGERYDRMLPTIITTNLTKDEIKKRYNERIYDRLRDTCNLVTFRGQSLRGNKEELNESRNA